MDARLRRHRILTLNSVGAAACAGGEAVSVMLGGSLVLKLGVVGLGAGHGIGHVHVENILNYPADWRLTAVCDVASDKVHQITDSAQEVRGFTDYSTFLSQAEVD